MVVVIRVLLNNGAAHREGAESVAVVAGGGGRCFRIRSYSGAGPASIT